MVLKYIFPFLFLLFSCKSYEWYYYDEEYMELLDEESKNPNSILIRPKLSNPYWSIKKRMAFYQKPQVFKFHQTQFENNEAIFSLSSPSTANVGILYMVSQNDTLKLDSTWTHYDDFVRLKLNPVEKGTYWIKSWGCRYGFDYKIIIK